MLNNKINRVTVVVHVDSLPTEDDAEFDLLLKEVVSTLKAYKVKVYFSNLEKLEHKQVSSLGA